MKEIKEISISLKSEPMNEMISHPPSWLIRSGSSAFFILMILFIGLSWLIKYPDEISGNVIISSSKPPIEMRNQAYLKLEHVHVYDKQEVKKNTLLAQFNNQANQKSIETVKKYLDKIENAVNEKNKKIITLTKKIDLGPMQDSWTKLDILITEWNQLCQNRIFERKIQSIQNEISLRTQLLGVLSQKMKLEENNYKLLKENLESSERLAVENIVSKQSLNQERQSETQAFQAIQNQKEAYLQNLITLNELNKQIYLIKNENQLQTNKYISDITFNIISLKSTLMNWEQTSYWIAPCDGKVLFNTQLQVNKYYKASEASIVIVPKGNDLIGLATIQSQGVGKVKVGQQAFIELANYPKNEFGLIEGKVSHITSIDNNGIYEVKLDLTNNLTTTYKSKIPYQVKLTGTVKIITKKKRLLERLFEKLFYLVDKTTK